MPLKNKDVNNILNSSGVSLSVNNHWGARTISGTVTMGGECLDELLKAINDSESYNIKIKTGEDTTITLNNVRFKSDVSNGNGDYMIYPITAEAVYVKEPERVKDNTSFEREYSLRYMGEKIPVRAPFKDILSELEDVP